MELAERESLGVIYPPTMSGSYPAVASSVSAARHALVAFAKSVGADEEQLDRVRLAASEALTNAVQHAYRGCGDSREAPIHVAAWLTRGELWILIADEGRGVCCRGDSRGLGLGLALIAELSESFQIVRRSGGGTEVRIQLRLAGDESDQPQERGLSSSASRPASSRFSTTR
jgi:anti-sigma regulatory factor (Ser/Thr protein kinase)